MGLIEIFVNIFLPVQPWTITYPLQWPRRAGPKAALADPETPQDLSRMAPGESVL